MKSLPYHLLEPNDVIQVGDFYIIVEEGNIPVKGPCHESWKGVPVRQCPRGLYLRPYRIGQVRSKQDK
jgi:hypothetical protein